jgi:dTDP-4-dehydrorhamnose 3,5-epimerase
MAKITESPEITGVYVVEPDIFGDERGKFIETYRRQWFPHGREMLQGNRADRAPAASSGCTTTCTRRTTGTSRSVPRRWCCTTCAPVAPPTAPRSCSELSGDNHLGVFIPPGVAHGFLAVTDMTITYLVDGYYNPNDELGVAWDDPALGVDWGITDPVLSNRDRQNPKRSEIPEGRRPSWPMRL